jgi:pimeloyl-ACP methyl ester carboxylesterase
MAKSSSKSKTIYYDSDGLQLCGIFHQYQGEKSKGNILLVHGIINDKDEDGNFIKLAKIFSKSSYNAFRFDFRAHGDSEGKSENVTIDGELKDLEKSIERYDQLLEKKSKLIIIASSFGAVSSILYTSIHEERIEKLVLWNPVLDFEKTFLKAETPWGQTIFNEKGYANLKKKGSILVPDTNFRFGKKLIEEFGKIKPYQILSTFKIPVLTIHGTEDRSVPYSVSKKYGAPNSFSKFISHKSDHCFVGIEDTVIDETVRWVLET